MELLKDLDLSYSKDKHASVRCLFQETFKLGEYARGGGKQPALVAVQALFIIEMNILCVESRVLLDPGIAPHTFNSMKKRILETHEFPAAVRRAVVLADSIREDALRDLLEDSSFFPA